MAIFFPLIRHFKLIISQQCSMKKSIFSLNPGQKNKTQDMIPTTNLAVQKGVLI